MGPVHGEIFMLREHSQVRPQLGDAIRHRRTQLPDGHVIARHRTTRLRGQRRDEAVDQPQEPPRLRRQIIQTAPQDHVRELVGQADVIGRGHDCFHRAPINHARFARPLKLMDEGHRFDQVEILPMIAPEARPVRGEGQPGRIRVDHRHRPQEPLGVGV